MSKNNLWKSFGATATITGFIVDCVTLFSILLNLNLRFTNSVFANAWLGFLVALLATISYTGYLHTFWENNLEKLRLQSRFSGFLKDDMILDFRFPFHILPIVVLIALVSGLIFFEPLLIIPIIVLSFGLFVIVLLRITRDKPSFPPLSRAIIENNWDTIEQRITKEIIQFTEFVLGIRAENLKDLATVLDIETKDMNYALIKFAMLHPDVVEYDFNYGYLHGRVLEMLRKRPT